MVCCTAFAGVTAGEDWQQESSSFQLASLFRNRMVLQRDRTVKVWGSAVPDETVTVILAGREETTRADARGHWLVSLPAMPAGGPHSLRVRTSRGAATTIEDVLVGDVFLCSGQSNMVLPVARTLNSRAEIAAADNDDLRMLTVSSSSSPSPLTELTGPVVWQTATSDTVGDWSATCYYFARELQKVVDVPIGMVVAAVGGTAIRTWMSERALRQAGDHEEALTILELYTRDRSAALRRWGAIWEEWWRSQNGRDGVEPWRALELYEGGWTVAPSDLGVWEDWGVEDLTAFNGMVWFQETVRLTSELAAQPAVLLLGKIDEIDQTWVNGRLVGTTSGAGIDRHYALPAGLLREGDNLISINVLDTWESGGNLRRR